MNENKEVGPELPQLKRSWIPGVTWWRTRQANQLAQAAAQEAARVQEEERQAQLRAEQEETAREKTDLLARASTALLGLPIKRYTDFQKQLRIESITSQFTAANLGSFEASPWIVVAEIFNSEGQSATCTIKGKWLEGQETDYEEEDFQRIEVLHRAAIAASDFSRLAGSREWAYAWYTDRYGDRSGVAPYRATEFAEVWGGERRLSIGHFRGPRLDGKDVLGWQGVLIDGQFSYRVISHPTELNRYDGKPQYYQVVSLEKRVGGVQQDLTVEDLDVLEELEKANSFSRFNAVKWSSTQMFGTGISFEDIPDSIDIQKVFIDEIRREKDYRPRNVI